MNRGTIEMPRRPRPGTQRAEVLRLLEEAAPGWVSLRAFMIETGCGATHSVIDALRELGWEIENDSTERRDGRVMSKYRLIVDQEEVAP